MATPILATKLYRPRPRPRPDVVERPRLIAQLNAGLHAKLTLISAPAGFGKTTLVTNWLEQLPPTAHQVGWLALDEADGDPLRFFHYLVAALQSAAPSIGEHAAALLATPPPAVEAVLTSLLNDLAALPNMIILVLDDYHTLESPPVDAALTFLLDHQPPQLHLVITTREDPALPLPRLRARGQLSDLRADALRFTPAEAAAFLNQVMGLALSSQEIAALEARTEGWIAGLQLAALSMQGHDDTADFIAAFAGDNRYIVDYLLEEVLLRQPEAVRAFLLQTSILETLSGPLCAAVTQRDDSAARLEELERGNLFLVPLDDKRRWYRYHHLFGDVLQARAVAEYAKEMRLLHQRASAWYAQHDRLADAIRHALAAADFVRAAELIELVWRPMDRQLQSPQWLKWARQIPDEMVRTRPVLSAGYGWALLDAGEMEAAAAWFDEAERPLDLSAPAEETQEQAPGEMFIADEAEFRILPASIASARAYMAQARGDLPEVIAQVQRALDFLPADDHLGRAIPLAISGLAYWTQGDLTAAQQNLTAAMNSFQVTGNVVGALSGTSSLADISIAQGRLHAATALYAQSLALAIGPGQPALRAATDIYLGLSELAHERGQAAVAADYLAKSEQLGLQAASPQWLSRVHVARARMAESRGEPDSALDLLDRAARHFLAGTPLPDLRPIAALKARLWVRQGRLAEAQAWAEERKLALDDDLSYLREFEHMTLARLLVAQSAHDSSGLTRGLELLARLLQAAEGAGRMGSVIEILILQALAEQSQGDHAAARAALARALTLAEPEGYVRIFTDEGRPLAQLLAAVSAEGVMSAYADKLLAVLRADAMKLESNKIEDGKIEDLNGQAPPFSGMAAAGKSAVEPLIEPLSERELEVLQLIAQGLSNREIGERLFLALSTVKGHNQNIFSKLQVKRRTEAVARARELGIVQ